MSRTQSFRVVVDGSPLLNKPTTRYEHSTPHGWAEYRTATPELSTQKAKWVFRVESSDSECDFDYEVALKKPCDVKELDQFLQGYAKNLLEGSDPGSISKLQLTARIAG